jgi:hypothetical protein
MRTIAMTVAVRPYQVGTRAISSSLFDVCVFSLVGLGMSATALLLLPADAVASILSALG